MAEDGQLARIAGRPASAAPSMADLLDPIALEERLREARARRAEALARRPEGEAALVPAPRRDAPPAFLKHPAAEPAASRRGAAAYLVLIFLAGLGLGGAAVAVLALRTLPDRIAALPSAASPTDPAPAAAAPIPSVSAPPVSTPSEVAAPPPEVAASPAAPAAASAAPGRDAPPPAEAALTLPDPAGLPEPAFADAPPEADALPPILEAALPPLRTETAPAAAVADVPAADPASLPAQVVIHYPSSASATAAEVREALRSAGVAKVEIIRVSFAIGRSNIRFYHDGDRQPAAALAPLVAPVLAGEPPEARDFTDYATPAAPGKIELWLAGNPPQAEPRTAPRAPARAAPASPRRAAPTATAFQMPGVIAPPRSQAQQVERILIERLRQQGR